MSSDTIPLLDNYVRIATIDENHRVFLVQHKLSRNIYVEKILTIYSHSVFQCLAQNHIKGTPQIIEIIEDEGHLILIEEYISGRTIRSILDDGNLFSEEDAARIVADLCQILSDLHNLNPAIIHRDIKPSNVILTSDGEVKLIDLNAAKVYQPEKTEDTALLGTVGYAAPEQYGFGVSNAQADIYAVGILLNEMILGVPPKSAIPDGRIGNIIRKCTMMDPKDRYSTVEDLIADLNRKTPGIAPDSNPSGQSKFRIPGFRTGNTSHIAAGIIGYSFIFFLGLTLKVQEAKSAVALWIERCFFIAICFAAVLFTFDYMGIWKKFGLDRIKNPAIKVLMVLGVDFLILILSLMIMAIIESILL